MSLSVDTLKARTAGAAVTTTEGLNVGGACTATSFVGDVIIIDDDDGDDDDAIWKGTLLTFEKAVRFTIFASELACRQQLLAYVIRL